MNIADACTDPPDNCVDVVKSISVASNLCPPISPPNPTSDGSGSARASTLHSLAQENPAPGSQGPNPLALVPGQATEKLRARGSQGGATSELFPQGEHGAGLRRAFSECPLRQPPSPAQEDTDRPLCVRDLGSDEGDSLPPTLAGTLGSLAGKV